MNFVFRHKRISGLQVVVPENESHYDDEIEHFNFPPANSKKLKRVLGFDRHRVVTAGTCASDLAVHGMQNLFDRGLLNASEIDALILVTETPDYFMPPTSNVIQGKLGLGTDLWCIDINQGCAGFVVGLIQGFMMLEQSCIRKVVLINADTLTRTCSPRDRNAWPILGDAASITILESSDDAGPVFANLRMDGSQHEAIMIPAGGFRIPHSDRTSAQCEADDGNIRSLENYHMDGIAVLNFVQTSIPPLVDELLEQAGKTKDDVDWFMFHQPNRFMLEKLADRMDVPREKMPNHIVENFGNASSVTVPTAIVHTVGDQLIQNRYTMCLCGFGVGLTWSSMLIDIGSLQFAEMTEYPGGETA